MKKYTNKQIEKSVEEYNRQQKKEKMPFNDNITTQEFCGITDIDKRTLSRKIVKGQVNPRIIKSKQGTREYRFSDTDIKAFFWDKLPLEVKSNR